MYRVWNFLTEYSLLMVVGAVIALLWANINPDGYHAVVDLPLLTGWGVGELHEATDGGPPTRVLSLHFLVNDVLMALFFAIAGKEVWEAVVLEEGSLRGAKAAVPLIATAGGMLGPAAVYLGLAAAMGSDAWDALARGWAVPTATDIAFSYLVARLIFGAGHPALRFLLLLAIADDAAGLVIIAVVYPSSDLAPAWLLLSLGAAVGVFLLFNRLPLRLDAGRAGQPWSGWARRRLSVWPYVVAGALSWYGFQRAGLHPALGLLPIVPTIPHAERSFGVYAAAEAGLTDLLNAIEHGLKRPVEGVLFLFGLLNAGVALTAVGAPTWLVLAGLFVGKPLGILAFAWVAAKPLRLGLPQGMTLGDVAVLGQVAGIGFTVSLFVASVAFSPGATLGGVPVQDAAKLGALLSVGAGAIAWVAAQVLEVRRVPG